MTAARARLLENIALSLGLHRSRRGVTGLALEADATWSGRAGAEGLEIRCLSGTVWVTLEEDPEDHVLSAGEIFVAGRAGRLAIMAFEPARVRIVGCAEQPRDTTLIRQESSP